MVRQEQQVVQVLVHLDQLGKLALQVPLVKPDPLVELVLLVYLVRRDLQAVQELLVKPDPPAEPGQPENPDPPAEPEPQV